MRVRHHARIPAVVVFVLSISTAGASRQLSGIFAVFMKLASCDLQHVIL